MQSDQNSLSYWDQQMWFSSIDFTVVGSGIVGLNCALRLRQKYPKAKILVLERGAWPQGASTKNAGFACFGSVSELLSDLENHSQDEVLDLVKQRRDGLRLLRNTLGDKALGYKAYGGYELFLEKDKDLYVKCADELSTLNALLSPLFESDVFYNKRNQFGFQDCLDQVLYNAFEGQVDTAKMMSALLNKAKQEHIQILNNCELQSYEQVTNGVHLKSNLSEFYTKHLFIATNGFAQALDIKGVKPARAQVLLTKPIKDLHIKGTFHLDEGFYYFRNIDNRILFGGGRNLDFDAEETSNFGTTHLVQKQLEKYLKNVILPETNFEIDLRWSGIMGVGSQKKPVLKSISNNVHCGIRLGGMGIALGSKLGSDLAECIV